MTTVPCATPVHTRRLARPVLCALLIAVVLVSLWALLSFGDNGNAARLSELNAQSSGLSAALAQMDTLTQRYEKRQTQLQEAKDALNAAPEDKKLASKLERAQAEYDRALANLERQRTVVSQFPDANTLSAETMALKESGAGRTLIANSLLACAALALAAFIALRMQNFGKRSMYAMAALLPGMALMLAGIHQNNLSPALEAGQTYPGTKLIAIGMVLFVIAYILYWALVTKARLNLKTAVGSAVTLGAGGLILAGFLDNNAPDAAGRYINAMSPGFLSIFAGVILLALGTLILALPITRLRYDIRKNPMLLVMILPSIAFFLITSYLPMVGVYFGFTNYKFTTDFFSTLFGSEFVGLSNFKYLFSSGLAWQMTANTITYNFIFIVVGTILKVGIAIMFSEIAGKRYKKCVQTITFLPHFISMVMVGTFAYSLLNYSSGVINSALVSLGLNRTDFYSMPNAWYIIIPMVEFWKSVGYGSIIYVSAITGISDELYEAADLDGASFMQQIRHITIPCIRPTIIILTLMSLGSIMKGNFDLFYQLVGQSGQLMETTEIIDTYVWRSLRQNVQIGMGSAAGLYQSFVGMILVVLVNGVVKKIEPDYALF